MDHEIMREMQARREKREAERRALLEEMQNKVRDRQRRVANGTSQESLRHELEHRRNQARMLIHDAHSGYDVDHTGGAASELRREIARGHLEGMRHYTDHKYQKK